MFIESSNTEQIPKGAIRLTREEVYEYMTDLIRKWPNSMEIWALKHGNPILASAVVLSSSVILNFYRKKLQLRDYGRFTLFLPVVLVPSIFNLMYQSTYTTKSIVLLEECTTCTAVQSTFIQIGTGIVYPVMGAIGGTYMFGNKMGTVSFQSNGFNVLKEFSTHLLKTSLPLNNRLTVFVIGHALLSYAITHYQTENFEFLRLKMLEQQREEIESLQKSKEAKLKPERN